MGGYIIGRVGFWLQKSWGSWGSQEMPENSILAQALPPLRKLNEAHWPDGASVPPPCSPHRGMFLPMSVRGWELGARVGLSLASLELCSCLPLLLGLTSMHPGLGKMLSLRLKKAIGQHCRQSPSSWGSSSHPESDSGSPKETRLACRCCWACLPKSLSPRHTPKGREKGGGPGWASWVSCEGRSI